MAFDNKRQQSKRPQGRDNRRPRRDNNRRTEEPVEVWVPKTQLGKDVAEGKVTNMTEVLLANKPVLEYQITDKLLPNLETSFVNLGQAKGKFGGGQRRPSKQTQKITEEGSKMSFAMLALSGNRDGIVGLGFGKSRETVPSREKALKKAKTNLIVIRRGNGSWGSFGAGSTSIPFSVEGKSGSCKVKLIPAPVGTGLVVEDELKKMLQLAGIKDVWSKTSGSTKNKINLMKAGFNALKNLQKVKLTPATAAGRALKEGDRDEQY